MQAPRGDIVNFDGVMGSNKRAPHHGTCIQFYRDSNSAFSSLVDSRRIVPTHAARRSQRLILFSHFCK